MGATNLLVPVVDKFQSNYSSSGLVPGPRALTYFGPFGPQYSCAHGRKTESIKKPIANLFYKIHLNEGHWHTIHSGPEIRKWFL